MDLLAEVERFIQVHGIAVSRFGRDAVGDPRLVFDMRNGRVARPRMAGRVRHFIAGYPGGGQ